MKFFRMRTVLTGALGLFLALLLFGSSSRPSSANVSLAYFRATATSTNVQIEWRTETEFETAGFHIKRATSADGFIDVEDANWDDDLVNMAYEGSTTDFVFGKGGSAPATYNAVDSDVVVGQTYYYMLVELELDGDLLPQTEHTVSVIAGQLPTATPEPSGLNLATAVPTNAPVVVTNTPLPAATTDATSTSDGSDDAAATRRPAAGSTPTPAAIAPTATPASGNAVAPTATVGVSSGGGGGDGPLPTAIVVEPTQEIQSNKDSAVGIAVAEASTEDEAYPAPENTDDAARDGEAYVAPETSADGGVNTIGGDGSQASDDGGTSAETTTGELPPAIDSNTQNDSAKSSRSLLWVTFAAGLVIFGGGVAVSTRLFSRK